MKIIDVAAAILIQRGQILIARRAAGDRLAGFWEFPGGKLEAGETPRSCLRRELHEEFGIHTRIGRFFDQTEYGDGQQAVRLLVYEAAIEHGDLQPRVHSAVRWVTPVEMHDYRFAPADRPIVARLQTDAAALGVRNHEAD